MKRKIHMRCPHCGWWQVRAMNDLVLMFTPCEAHWPDAKPEQLSKDEVEIVE
jgi:phage terminase large subunit GpA-like protein